VVPGLHAAIFLMPLAMPRFFLPEALAASWLTVFSLEIVIYAVAPPSSCC